MTQYVGVWSLGEGCLCTVEVNLMLVKNAGSVLECSAVKGKIMNGQHRAL